MTPGGEVEIERETFTVQPFYIAKYLITYTQFQAFVDAPDGFADNRWWAGMPEQDQKQQPGSQRAKMKNAPRDSISWYQAVAFARWLDAKYRERGMFAHFPVGTPDGVSGEGGVSADGRAVARPYETITLNPDQWQIRLPTEWEWQWAAQGGADQRRYPWGDWQSGYANISEAGLSRTTAVGMYPQGMAACGALDVAGNLWEWCLNDYSKSEIIDYYSNRERKVLRGGSFNLNLFNAAASFRNYDPPSNLNYNCGLRLVCAAPVRL